MKMAEEMQKIKGEVEGLTMELNVKAQEGVPNPTMQITVNGEKEEVYIEDEIDARINKYTSLSRAVCFEECAATEDAMLTAIKLLSFKTIALKKTMKGEDKKNRITVYEVIEKDKQIDLLKLHKFVKDRGGKGIGKDLRWEAYVEKMNFHMAARQAKRLTKEKGNLTETLKRLNDGYVMSDIAKALDMGKNPVSNTQLLKTLQSVIDAMIGEEYKATSHDVNFLVDLYAKKGRKALEVNCANHSYFRGYIMCIAHSIVTGEDYETSFKTKK